MPKGPLIKKEILEILSKKSDEVWYITKLAEEMPVSKTAVSNHIKELEKKGKVESYKRAGSRAKYVKIKEEKGDMGKELNKEIPEFSLR